MPGRDVACPAPSPALPPPARELFSCPVSQPHSSHLATLQLLHCAIALLTPDQLSISPYSRSISLPTHFPSLSPSICHPFVVSTPALSNSSHVSFRDVRTKTFSTHVTTQIGPDVRETWLFAHARASLISKIISMCTPVSQCHVYVMPGRDVACPAPSPRCHPLPISSHVSFHNVRTKTFSAHVTT